MAAVGADVSGRRDEYEQLIEREQQTIDALVVDIVETEEKCQSYVSAFDKIMGKLGVPDVDSMVAHVIGEEASMYVAMLAVETVHPSPAAPTSYKLFVYVQELNRCIDLKHAEANAAASKLDALQCELKEAARQRELKARAHEATIAELKSASAERGQVAAGLKEEVLTALRAVKSLHSASGCVVRFTISVVVGLATCLLRSPHRRTSCSAWGTTTRRRSTRKRGRCVLSRCACLQHATPTFELLPLLPCSTGHVRVDDRARRPDAGSRCAVRAASTVHCACSTFADGSALGLWHQVYRSHRDEVRANHCPVCPPHEEIPERDVEATGAKAQAPTDFSGCHNKPILPGRNGGAAWF